MIFSYLMMWDVFVSTVFCVTWSATVYNINKINLVSSNIKSLAVIAIVNKFGIIIISWYDLNYSTVFLWCK